MDKIQLLALRDLNIDLKELQEFLAPYFESLEWDYYDVRQQQIKNAEVSDHSLARKYYLGEIDFETLISKLPSKVQSKKLANILPYRKKALSTLSLEYDQNHWRINNILSKPLIQITPEDDIRLLPRDYNSIPASVFESSIISDLISKICSLVKAQEPSMVVMELNFWLMSCLVNRKQSATNSPEGIHQDGADYIVSALVVNRKNIQGGESRVYASDKKTVLLKTILQEGEFILMPDKNSEYWHDVRPISVADPNQQLGSREIIGLDFHIVK